MWSCIDREFTRPENFSKGFENKTFWFTLSLDQWLYWWWFWFGFLWMFYFMLTVHLLERRQFKFHSKINTSLRSHSKWGDFFVSVIPLIWCFNIIWHSNLMLRNFENQQNATAFTLKIIGRQWYWVYKYDMDLFSKEYNKKFDIGNNRWVNYCKPLDSALFNLEVQRVAKLGGWRENYSNLLFSNLVEETDGYLFNDSFFFYKFYDFQNKLKSLNFFFFKKKNKFKFILDLSFGIFNYLNKLGVGFTFGRYNFRFFFKNFFFLEYGVFFPFLKMSIFRVFLEKNFFFCKKSYRIVRNYDKFRSKIYFKPILRLNYIAWIGLFHYNLYFDSYLELYRYVYMDESCYFDENFGCPFSEVSDTGVLGTLDTANFVEILKSAHNREEGAMRVFFEVFGKNFKSFESFVFYFRVTNPTVKQYMKKTPVFSEEATKNYVFFFLLKYFYNCNLAYGGLFFKFRKFFFKFGSRRFVNFAFELFKFKYNLFDYRFVNFFYYFLFKRNTFFFKKHVSLLKRLGVGKIKYKFVVLSFIVFPYLTDQNFFSKLKVFFLKKSLNVRFNFFFKKTNKFFFDFLFLNFFNDLVLKLRFKFFNKLLVTHYCSKFFSKSKFLKFYLNLKYKIGYGFISFFYYSFFKKNMYFFKKFEFLLNRLKVEKTECEFVVFKESPIARFNFFFKETDKFFFKKLAFLLKRLRGEEIGHEFDVFKKIVNVRFNVLFKEPRRFVFKKFEFLLKRLKVEKIERESAVFVFFFKGINKFFFNFLFLNFFNDFVLKLKFKFFNKLFENLQFLLRRLKAEKAEREFVVFKKSLNVRFNFFFKKFLNVRFNFFFKKTNKFFFDFLFLNFFNDLVLRLRFKFFNKLFVTHYCSKFFSKSNFLKFYLNWKHKINYGFIFFFYYSFFKKNMYFLRRFEFFLKRLKVEKTKCGFVVFKESPIARFNFFFKESDKFFFKKLAFLLKRLKVEKIECGPTVVREIVNVRFNALFKESKRFVFKKFKFLLKRSKMGEIERESADFIFFFKDIDGFFFNFLFLNFFNDFVLKLKFKFFNKLFENLQFLLRRLKAEKVEREFVVFKKSLNVRFNFFFKKFLNVRFNFFFKKTNKFFFDFLFLNFFNDLVLRLRFKFFNKLFVTHYCSKFFSKSNFLKFYLNWKHKINYGFIFFFYYSFFKKNMYFLRRFEFFLKRLKVEKTKCGFVVFKESPIARFNFFFKESDKFFFKKLAFLLKRLKVEKIECGPTVVREIVNVRFNALFKESKRFVFKKFKFLLKRSKMGEIERESADFIFFFKDIDGFFFNFLFLNFFNDFVLKLKFKFFNKLFENLQFLLRRLKAEKVEREFVVFKKSLNVRFNFFFKKSLNVRFNFFFKKINEFFFDFLFLDFLKFYLNLKYKTNYGFIFFFYYSFFKKNMYFLRRFELFLKRLRVEKTECEFVVFKESPIARFNFFFKETDKSFFKKLAFLLKRLKVEKIEREPVVFIFFFKDINKFFFNFLFLNFFNDFILKLKFKFFNKLFENLQFLLRRLKVEKTEREFVVFKKSLNVRFNFFFKRTNKFFFDFLFLNFFNDLVLKLRFKFFNKLLVTHYCSKFFSKSNFLKFYLNLKYKTNYGFIFFFYYSFFKKNMYFLKKFEFLLNGLKVEKTECEFVVFKESPIARFNFFFKETDKSFFKKLEFLLKGLKVEETERKFFVFKESLSVRFNFFFKETNKFVFNFLFLNFFNDLVLKLRFKFFNKLLVTHYCSNFFFKSRFLKFYLKRKVEFFFFKLFPFYRKRRIYVFFYANIRFLMRNFNFFFLYKNFKKLDFEVKLFLLKSFFVTKVGFFNKISYFDSRIRFFGADIVSTLGSKFLFKKYTNACLNLKLDKYGYFFYIKNKRIVNYFSFYKKVFSYSYSFFFIKNYDIIYYNSKVRNLKYVPNFDLFSIFFFFIRREFMLKRFFFKIKYSFFNFDWFLRRKFSINFYWFKYFSFYGFFFKNRKNLFYSFYLKFFLFRRIKCGVVVNRLKDNVGFKWGYDCGNYNSFFFKKVVKDKILYIKSQYDFWMEQKLEHRLFMLDYFSEDLFNVLNSFISNLYKYDIFFFCKMGDELSSYLELDIIDDWWDVSTRVFTLFEDGGVPGLFFLFVNSEYTILDFNVFLNPNLLRQFSFLRNFVFNDKLVNSCNKYFFSLKLLPFKIFTLSSIGEVLNLQVFLESDFLREKDISDFTYYTIVQKRQIPLRDLSYVIYDSFYYDQLRKYEQIIAEKRRLKGLVDSGKLTNVDESLYEPSKVTFYADQNLWLLENNEKFISSKINKLLSFQKLRSKKTPQHLEDRLLLVDEILLLPLNTNIRLMTSSYDVVHSWFIPGLGMKFDCVPGKCTHHSLRIDTPGFYYGQCAEICGRFHHHMPIRICVVPIEHFVLWWREFSIQRNLAHKDKLEKNFKEDIKMRVYRW